MTIPGQVGLLSRTLSQDNTKLDTFNSSTGHQRQMDFCEFKTSMVYMVSSGQLGLHTETLSQKQNKIKKHTEKKKKFLKKGCYFLPTRKLEMSSEFMSHMGDLLIISPKLEPTVSKDCGLSLTNRHIWSCFSKKTGVSTLFFGLGTGPGAAGRLAFVWRNIKVRLNRLLSLSFPLSKQLCWKWLNLTRAAFFWQ